MLADDQGWATFVSGMMLTSEAFNMKENDTVCAAFFCTKSFDQLPIMPMWKKFTVTQWLHLRGHLPGDEWNGNALLGQLAAARCAAESREAINGFEPSSVEVPRTRGLDGGWRRSSQKGSEKADTNISDK